VRGVDEELRRELILMGGLDADLSLIAVHLNEVKRKMEEHPWIRSVKVERRFPHTLVIDAEMQQPRALVLLEQLYYMNRWGEVFKEVGKSNDVDYPLVTGVPPDGTHRDVLLRRAADVLEMLAAEKPPWSLGDLSEVRVSPSGSISLYFEHLRAEVTFIWGGLENRISELKNVVGHLHQTGRLQEVRRIDFDYVNGAVVSFRNGYEPFSG
jgi:cell division protein FtsQ